jgi:phosphate-selective porin OprO/OprP
MPCLSHVDRGHRVAAACVLAACLAIAGAASAKPDGTAIERLLEIMLEQNTITQEQYDELLEQARRDEAVAKLAEGEKAQPAEWTFEWDDGFELERSDGTFLLEFGGSAQLDGAAIWEGNGLESDLTAAGQSSEGVGVEFRRARIYFQGTVYERLFFKAEYDFAEGGSDLKDVYMGLKELGPVGSVQVGQFKEPFFLDEQTSSSDITFMERALNNAFLPDLRNVGAMAMNTAAEQRFLWQLGIFRATSGFRGTFSDFDETNWDVALRVSGLPLWSDEGRRFVHLGTAYVHRFRADTAHFNQRPESHLAGRFVDTMPFDATGIDIAGAELAWVNGPFSTQAEYTHAFVNGDDGQRSGDFWGAYGQVSYFLTGEHRPYELGNGKFGRVEPKRNFDPPSGDWGAFELAARFSYLDLNDGGIRGGKLWDATAGLNWYLFPNARVMLNYIHADVSDRIEQDFLTTIHLSGTGDIVQARFQVDF